MIQKPNCGHHHGSFQHPQDKKWLQQCRSHGVNNIGYRTYCPIITFLLQEIHEQSLPLNKYTFETAFTHRNFARWHICRYQLAAVTWLPPWRCYRGAARAHSSPSSRHAARTHFVCASTPPAAARKHGLPPANRQAGQAEHAFTLPPPAAACCHRTFTFFALWLKVAKLCTSAALPYCESDILLSSC
ncbi:hypothetical protein NPIL_236031 [Nephila pilipes]|uniref:Uncharacterized protein n=1 Tax=Nephila pilipes TaxID=299642 RepID=A0A8X6TBA8_NEPPI|nr:hypothetical protein NPIL_236031 [Nephila pilipes]